jgi:hypothetical protein
MHHQRWKNGEWCITDSDIYGYASLCKTKLKLVHGKQRTRRVKVMHHCEERHSDASVAQPQPELSESKWCITAREASSNALPPTSEKWVVHHQLRNIHRRNALPHKGVVMHHKWVVHQRLGHIISLCITSTWEKNDASPVYDASAILNAMGTQVINSHLRVASCNTTGTSNSEWKQNSCHI